jgi:transcriptional regulator NrdR family protein
MQSAARNVTPLFDAQSYVPRVTCPACRSSAIQTTRTMPVEDGETARVRYHKCRICRALFKSVEALASLSTR